MSVLCLQRFPPKRSAVITGGTSGIGLAAAKQPHAAEDASYITGVETASRRRPHSTLTGVNAGHQDGVVIGPREEIDEHSKKRSGPEEGPLIHAFVPGDMVVEALRQMRENRVRSVLVIDDDVLVGIVTQGDCAIEVLVLPGLDAKQTLRAK